MTNSSALGRSVNAVSSCAPRRNRTYNLVIKRDYTDPSEPESPRDHNDLAGQTATGADRSGPERPTVPHLFLCPRCGESKPREAFTGKSRRASYCRPCYTDYQRDYRDTPHGNLKFNATQRAIRKRLPERYGARVAVMHALARGTLVKGPCELGNGCEGPIEAHHEDYTKPLEGRWLCRTHHKQIDREKFGRRPAAGSPLSHPHRRARKWIAIRR